MKHAYRIDSKRRFIDSRYEGEFDMDSFLSGFGAVTGDPAFDPDFDVLVDLSRCRLRVRPRDIPNISELYDAKYEGGRGRTAILLNDPMVTALAMLFQKRVRSRETRLFSTREKAMEWLGVKV